MSLSVSIVRDLELREQGMREYRSQSLIPEQDYEILIVVLALDWARAGASAKAAALVVELGLEFVDNRIPVLMDNDVFGGQLNELAQILDRHFPESDIQVQYLGLGNQRGLSA